MNTLMVILTCFWFIQIFKWIVTIVYYIKFMNPIERQLATIKLNFLDNIIWIYPIIYFTI